EAASNADYGVRARSTQAHKLLLSSTSTCAQCTIPRVSTHATKRPFGKHPRDTHGRRPCELGILNAREVIRQRFDSPGFCPSSVFGGVDGSGCFPWSGMVDSSPDGCAPRLSGAFSLGAALGPPP